MHPHLIFIALVSASLACPRAGGIAWESSFDEALARAKSERRVVFVAVNMDGERANDRLAEEVYAEKRILELSRATSALVASAFDHGSGGERPCPRFGALSCDAHRKLDIAVRERVLKPDAAGYVVAPQHVFLDPEGAVILSVPYEVGAGELEWCFVTALRTVDPDFDWKLSSDARAPQRLILGGVYELGPASGGRPITREEVLEAIGEVKKGVMSYDERFSALRTILCADEPEAIEFIRTEVRSERGATVRARLLHELGVYSPRSYWEIAAEYAVGGEEALRAEAVVALEQLAAPESVKTLETALRKEKEPRIAKDILRALGSAGATDKGAHRKLLEIATKERDALLRRNAIVALGSLAPAEDVRAALTGLVKAADPGREGAREDRIAAVCAMGMSRDASWSAPLEQVRKQAEDAGDGDLLEACDAALQALRDGGLQPLRAPLRKVAQDEIERERLFGPAEG